MKQVSNLDSKQGRIAAMLQFWDKRELLIKLGALNKASINIKLVSPIL